MTDFINKLTLAYPKAHDCLETDNKSDFWVSEDTTTKKSFIVRSSLEIEEQEVMLKVNNPHTKDINLLCIDACIYSSADISRCDCALFDDDKFCFVNLNLKLKIGEQQVKTCEKPGTYSCQIPFHLLNRQ
jgi:hypothetical protein